MTTKKFKFNENIMALSYTKDMANLNTEWIQLAYEEHDDNSRQCICEHKIKYMYRYLNTKTGHMINVGSECVKKLRLNNCRNAKSIFRDYISGIPGEYECIGDLIKYSLANWALFLQNIKDKVKLEWNNTNGLIELDKIIQMLTLRNISCEEIVQIMHKVSNEIKKKEEASERIRKHMEETEKKRLYEEEQQKKATELWMKELEKRRENKRIRHEEEIREQNEREQREKKEAERREIQRVIMEERHKQMILDGKSWQVKEELYEMKKIEMGDELKNQARAYFTRVNPKRHPFKEEIKKRCRTIIETIIDKEYPILAKHRLVIF
jgi:hypothetical protein